MAAALDWLLSKKTNTTDDIIFPLTLSQYSLSNGNSSCTAIASVFCASFLARLNSRFCIDTNRITSELTDILIEGVEEYIKYRQAIFSDVEHLSTEDFYKTNENLQRKIKLVGSPIQKILSQGNPFLDLILEAKNHASVNPKEYIGIILTKPPETVTIILPPPQQSISTDLSADKCYLFDSHSRPSLGIEGTC